MIYVDIANYRGISVRVAEIEGGRARGTRRIELLVPGSRYPWKFTPEETFELIDVLECALEMTNSAVRFKGEDL